MCMCIYICIYIPTYLHTYIHTYMHTYIHTYTIMHIQAGGVARLPSRSLYR